ncbi:BlaI/MecI/CopY family transcriptional regulator [Paenibacillus sp. 1P03SA]|uniref:BlaI/MecI/CopY family transcriptional regulator n=1 Tax=Paenibacillus sp. 1P03SA TaxID=3132294 RepID=UPI0039A1AAA7
MNPNLRISDAEWEIMKVLWSVKKSLTASEIIESINHPEWSSKTVRTLIARLVQKNAIKADMSSRTYQYYALYEEKDCILAETQSFLHKVRGNLFKPVIVEFLNRRSLSKEDIEELRSLLDKRSGD